MCSHVAPVPETFASVFRADAKGDDQIRFHAHSSSWAGMNTRFTWDSFSQCTIALINVPSANLWSQGKSTYEVIDPEGIVIKDGTVDGTITFAVQLTHPSSHTLRVVSNAVSKEFEFSPPISFQLVESEEPSELHQNPPRCISHRMPISQDPLQSSGRVLRETTILKISVHF